MFKASTKGYLYPFAVPTYGIDDKRTSDTILYLFRPDNSSELVHLVPHLRGLLPVVNFVKGELATITITRLTKDARALSIQARGMVDFNRLDGVSSLCVGRSFDLISQLYEGEYEFTLELHERNDL